MVDCVQSCGKKNCGHPRKEHSKNGCEHGSGCTCGQSYMDVGREHRDKREKGGRG